MQQSHQAWQRDKQKKGLTKDALYQVPVCAVCSSIPPEQTIQQHAYVIGDDCAQQQCSDGRRPSHLTEGKRQWVAKWLLVLQRSAADI